MVRVFVLALLLLKGTVSYSQPLIRYDIYEINEYRPIVAFDGSDDRSLEPMAWSAFKPRKMALAFEALPYTCCSNTLSFQISNGNIVIYPDATEGTTIRGRQQPPEFEAGQANTFVLAIGSPTCRYKIAVQSLDIDGLHWRAKTIEPTNPLEVSLSNIWKKLRDEDISDADRSNFTAERKRLESELNKQTEKYIEGLKNALTSKGYDADQPISSIHERRDSLSKTSASFRSDFRPSTNCLFGSGHIDFSGDNPVMAYVANPPTESADDNWFETRIINPRRDDEYEIIFSNRRCAVQIELSKEVKTRGNWISLPAMQ